MLYDLSGRSERSHICETEAENFAAKLKEQYLSLLRRKAKSDKVYDQVCIGLKDVDKLSEILKKLDIKQVKSSS